MTPKREILLANLIPRGLRRVEAAAYIGVGVTKFDEMVRDRLMPQPKVVNSKIKVWDRHQLDISFAALPDEDGEADDVWNELAV